MVSYRSKWAAVAALVFFWLIPGGPAAAQDQATTGQTTAEQTAPEPAAQEPGSPTEKGAGTAAYEMVVVAPPVIEGNQTNRLGSEVTTVSEQQIEDLNAQDLPSALRRTPGVVISRHNPVGSFGGGSGGAVFIRGLGAGRPGQDLVTTLDGIPLMVGVWTHSVMDMLSIDNVEAVEVYKGAQPVLYGNNSFAVINLKPKYQREEGFIGQAKLAGGSYNTLVEVAQTGGKIADFDYYLVQSYRASDGQRDDAGGSLQNYYGNLGYSLGEHLRFSLLVNNTHNWSDDPGPEGRPDLKEGTFKTRDTMALAKLENQYAWGHGYLQFYQDDGHLDWQDQSDGSDTRTDYENYGVRVRQNLTLWSGGVLTLGLDQDYISGKVLIVSAAGSQNGGNQETFRLTQPYAALSQEIPLGPFTLIPSAGVRYFDHSDFDSEPGYQAGAILRYQESELHANFAHTYNYPGVYVVQQSKLFWKNSLWEDLNPEELDHCELGVAQRFAPWIKADLTYFRDQGSDRLVLVYGPPHWENIGDFDNQGVEATLTVDPIKDLSLFLGLTYIDRSPEDNPYTPEWSGSAGANWRFWQRFLLSVDALYLDSYYVSDTRYAGSRQEVDSYLIFNAMLSYEVPVRSLGVKVFVAGENLTNQDYEYKPGYPMPGINGMVGVELSF
ncbi:MAG: TonB-dependent receptor plug domain-containing protein [Deltaproteobacteria bacterium]|nr:TonB-dependent receptor plug domain-containing protein [Deltaproteobacteria bacterium]